MPSTAEDRPRVAGKIGLRRRIRRDLGGALEYLWELSGSLRLARVDAVLLEGRERETGLPLTVFYFGHYDNYAFLLRRIFSEYHVVERRQGIHSLSVNRWIAKYSERASLLFIDVELLYCKLVPAHRYLEIPQWIRQKYAVPETWEGVLASFRKNTKKVDLRRVRKYGFTYRTSCNEHDFKEFYHRMYVPYLTRRFEDEVIVEPEWKVLRQCRKGELMHIIRDDQIVAAVLLHLLGRRLAYVWVGVPEDLEESLFTGAFSAMYYFTIEYAHALGCDEIDFLGSRPLLNDGLFRYKRKWGTYVEDSPVPRGDILLRPLQFSEPIQGIFRSNSFIVRDGGSLVGKVLLSSGRVRPEEIESLFEQFFTNGLARLKVFSLRGFEEEAHHWARESGKQVELIDLSSSSEPANAFCEL